MLIRARLWPVLNTRYAALMATCCSTFCTSHGHDCENVGADADRLWLLSFQDLSAMRARLGKHKIGKSCLYVNKLADIDMDVLEEIVRFGLAYMRENYETVED